MFVMKNSKSAKISAITKNTALRSKPPSLRIILSASCSWLLIISSLFLFQCVCYEKICLEEDLREKI